MPRTETLKMLSEIKVAIPDAVTFRDLKLRYLEGGAVSFDYDVLRQVWISTGYHPELLAGAGTAEIAAFIVRFFSAYVKSGGVVDIETASVVGLLRDDTLPGRRLVPV